MGVRFYDEAFIKKISKWVKDPALRILKPEESTRLFELTADRKEDATLTLPLIAVSRLKDIDILNTQKQPKTFNGLKIRAYAADGTELTGAEFFNVLDNNQPRINTNLTPTKDIGKIVSVNVIPIQISYQIDIYTKGMAEVDEYLRNFIFNLINYPKLTVSLPYNDIKFEHDSNISLERSFTDNSDIKEHLFADQFVRFTLKVTLSDAYLFSIPVREPVRVSKISIAVKTDDNTDIEIVEYLSEKTS